MKVQLNQPLRVEISPIHGRLICRVFYGDQEKAAAPALLHAVGSLIAGQRPPEAVQVLTRAGILQPESSTATVPDEQRVRLKSSVTLNLRLQPVPGFREGPTGNQFVQVTPDNSLPIGMYIQPAILASIQQVDQALKTAWMVLLRGAQSQQVALDLTAARKILIGVVDQHLETDPVLARVFKWKNARKRTLKLEHALQKDTLFYPIESIQLTADRRAHTGPNATSILYQLRGSEKKTKAFGTLMGLLSKGSPFQAIENWVSQPGQQSLKQLWMDLQRLGWIEAEDSGQEAIELKPGQVMHIGHATLLARLGDRHVLMDPWFIPSSSSDLDLPIPLHALPPIDAIFVTHHHWDHVNLETLLKLDKTIPIYVPRQSILKSLIPKTTQLLKSLGFESVQSLNHGDGIDFEGGGRIEAAPFYGEDPTQLEYGANTYVLRHHEKAALVHVDSGTTLSGDSMVTQGVCEQLVAAHGPLNPVFATRRQERGTMLEHAWEYLLQPVSSWVQPTENCCNDAAFLAGLTEATQSQHLVLYSEGGADYYPIGTDFLRGSEANATDAAFEFGWDTLEQIRTSLGEKSALHCSKPGEIFQIGEGVVS